MTTVKNNIRSKGEDKKWITIKNIDNSINDYDKKDEDDDGE